MIDLTPLWMIYMRSLLKLQGLRSVFDECCGQSLCILVVRKLLVLLMVQNVLVQRVS